jgi:hypothetical protein
LFFLTQNVNLNLEKKVGIPRKKSGSRDKSRDSEKKISRKKSGSREKSRDPEKKSLDSKNKYFAEMSSPSHRTIGCHFILNSSVDLPAKKVLLLKKK